MACRLSSDERARIEAMRAAGLTVEETARRAAGLTVEETASRLGRHRSTVCRELARGGGGYGAVAVMARRGAQAAAAAALL